jgi:hypothetical protein
MDIFMFAKAAGFVIGGLVMYRLFAGKQQAPTDSEKTRSE